MSGLLARMMRRSIPALLAAALLSSLLGACEPAPRGHPQTATSLFLGTRIGDAGEVSAAQWDAFVARAIVPRLPAGCTLADAGGIWRSEKGSVARERTHVVFLVHERDDPAADAALEAIAADWKREFHQESVLRVDEPVTARFE